MTPANDATPNPAISLPSPTSCPHVQPQEPPKQPKQWHSKLHTLLAYTPPKCRYNPSHPPQFSMSLNILFAFAAGFTVANLYYNHPILHILARDFNVPYEKVAQIPTVMQAGYAVGLLFLCPLGDLLPRRPMVVGLVGGTAVLWIGLCITHNLAVFTAISFIVAITTVTPQLMLPLVGDLAPPNRRAAALSVVVSGLILGVLIARVLSGTMTDFISWRSVYWMSFGLQSVIFVLLWLFMPDYPSTNPDGLNYFKMLGSILVMLTKHPVLVQASTTSFFTACTFTSFWTTLTFLLAGEPYRFEPVSIGLFGLIGIAALFFSPMYARTVTDRFVPHLSVLVGEVACLVGICLGTYLGRFTVSGPILQAFFLDFGMTTAQIANRSSIYAIEPKARNRVNTAFMIAVFCGQLTGTAAGNHIYARAGWVGSGSASVGFMGCAIFTMVVRGPWESGWVGWSGGWSMVKRVGNSADGKTVEVLVLGVGDGKRDEEVGVVDGVVGDVVVDEADADRSKDGSTDEKDRSSEKSVSGEDGIVAGR